MRKIIKLLVLAIFLQSCFGNLFKSNLGTKTSTKIDTEDDGDKYSEEAFQSNIGVKSFQGLFYSMSALTGIEVTEQTVKSKYDEVKVSLPGANKFEGFNESIQKGVTILAATFCDVMVRNPDQYLTDAQNGKDLLGSDFDMNGNINETDINFITDKFVEKFYGETSSAEVKDSAKEKQRELLRNFMSDGETPTLSKDDYVFSSCLASLASLAVLAN